MRIVLLGATGQVGRELAATLPALGEVIACGRDRADLEHPDAVRSLLARERPDVIVNAAAYTAVDRAEAEPERAELVNATAVDRIAAEARRLDAVLVHYSTDYVFDGEAAGRRTETDPPRPRSVYGRTKLAGERAVAAAGGRHYVFRTSWVYALHGANFLRTILRLAAEREELAVVADQTGAPTPAALIAEITAEFLGRAGDAAAPAPGLYHLAPRGETTWHAYAEMLLTEARAAGLPLKVRPGGVRPLATAEYPTAARRPANSRLCTAKLEAALARRLPRWEDGVRAAVAALVAAAHD
ncbi:MAG: dTDP-4-dehydrorhamnose reductase [Planctomycetes bacterium]|nr:dTDP-4-dehydrorhamnose reductase [Planctomycetota bacterium]MBM4059089.1 dTDP-4-dehydrorhamnose reductase [Planctomycetota bacterium]